VEIAYVCDAYSERFQNGLKTVEDVTGKKPRAVVDFRRLLDDRNVDAVIVATPHHWHALATVLACQAGKDVYVEKPASHNIWEGRKMIEAARKYERVVQVGMQNRSSSYAESARDLVQSGKLGSIHLVRVFNMFIRKPFDTMPNVAVPAGMNWENWLGPAPTRPYNSMWFKDWLYFWDFSGGLLNDDAIHQLDLARLVIGKSYPKSVYHAGGTLSFKDSVEIPDTSMATFEYETLTLVVEQMWWAPYMKKTAESIRQSEELFPNWYPFDGTKVEIYGTKGMMLLERHGGGWQIYDEEGQKVAQDKETHTRMQAAHADNFLDCIRSRKRPNGDIEEGHISAGLCHMANISYRVGNRKLNFNSATETFGDDDEANQYLRRAYRRPWVIPGNV
jgi:predicted dehydrogenase